MIDGKYKNLIEKNLIGYYRDELGHKKIKNKIKERVKRTRAKNIIQKLKNNNIEIENKSILDVGSGWGEFMIEFLENRAKEVHGIEPDIKRVEIANELLKKYKNYNIITKGAENIEPENKYDLIICYTVLEHTQNPKKVLDFLFKSLKKGGTLYLYHPNYKYPYEGHYEVFYPPLIPKFLGRIYLRLIGKDSNFINHIKYVTYNKTLNEIKKDKTIFIEKDLIKEHYIKNKLLNFIFNTFGLYPNVEFLIRKR